MRKLINVKDLDEATVVAQYKGEKILRSGMKYYYVMPKQPIEEKAILIPFEIALELQAEIKRKDDKTIEKHIEFIQHKVLIDTPIAKIIEGTRGRYDGAYFYVMPDGNCKVISEELAKKMVKNLKREYNIK